MKRFVITENEKEQIKSLYQSKGFLNEFEEPEPVFSPSSGEFKQIFGFAEGKTKFDSTISKSATDFLRESLKSSIPTIQKYHNSPKFKLPQFITFEVRTSSTGSPEKNRQIANARMSYLTGLYTNVMKSFGVDAAVAEKLLSKSIKEYEPTKLDKNFYDPKLVQPKAEERMCVITVKPITEMGLTSDKIGEIGGSIIDASSFVNSYIVDLVDETELVNGFKKLQTYSDLVDIDNFMKNARLGTVQDFLNEQLFDDPEELKTIANHLNVISNRSGKGNIAKTNYSGVGLNTNASGRLIITIMI